MRPLRTAATSACTEEKGSAGGMVEERGTGWGEGDGGDGICTLPTMLCS